jgi:ABC-2 type transport system permease protein
MTQEGRAISDITALETGLRPASRAAAALEDLAKVPAFFRRDLLVLWSYRVAFLSDWVNLIVQVLLFYFLNRLIPSDKLPRFGGRPTSYIEFVTVALVVTTFMQVSLGHLVSALRQEQLMGTLESLLLTPTAPTTIQLGSIAYDILYVPVRTAVFLAIMSGIFGVHFHLGGLVPTVAILVVFVPCMWGLGLLGAAGVLTVRRGSGVTGIAATALMLASGAYFPIQYLPPWLQSLTQYNPVTIALDGARQAMLADAGWSVIWPSVLKLVPMASVSLMLGITAFRLALKRERRRGTIGLY